MSTKLIPRNIPTIRAPRMYGIFHSSPCIRRRLGSSADHQTSSPIQMKLMCWSAWTNGWRTAASKKIEKCQP